MVKVIGALGEIQKIDLELGAIEEEERGYEREISRLEEDLKRAGEELAALKPRVEELTTRVKEAQERVRENAERIKKDEGRINAVKNEKELGALTREIKSAQKAKKQAEDEQQAFNAKLSEIEAEAKAKESAVGEKTASIRRLSEELASKRCGWKGLVEERRKLRESIAAGLRPDVLRKYEAVRSRKGGRGLVQVKDETCQGCFIHIPPQTYIMLKKGTDEIITCPHCHRILYFEDKGKEGAS